MRVIKLGIISIIVFFIVFTLISFLFPSHVRISKAIDIHTSKSHQYIDSSIRSNWQGEWNVIENGTRGGYTVQWYMDFHLRWYPWEKFSSLLLEKRYGPVMEKGLTALKALLEKS